MPAAVKIEPAASERREFFASCASGLEGLLADELRQLGIGSVRPLASGVAFFGGLEAGLAACLWLRTASRVLLVLDRVAARDSDELYNNCLEIPWEQHIDVDLFFAVDARGSNDNLRNSQFVGQRVKDAIVDRIRRVKGDRPSVRPQRPDVLVNVNLHKDKATLSIDLSGEPLHRRGYRVASRAIEAPLRESLAAAVVLASGWGSAGGGGGVGARGGAGAGVGGADFDDSGGFLIDPLCGSGTIAIEAAMILADLAPGLSRSYWGFTNWLGNDPALWQSLLEQADTRHQQRRAELERLVDPPILASDIDSEAVRVAWQSAKRAGVDGYIDFQTSDVASLQLPEEYADQAGYLATNPPYGQRMSTAAQLPALYVALAGLAKAHAGGFRAAVITPDDLVEGYLSTVLAQPPEVRLPTMNGPISTIIRVWANTVAGDHARANVDNPGLIHMEIDTTAFANRLAKMTRHRGRWARRSGVGCYRLYDADLPDFNFAIDLYQGAGGTADDGQSWLHIAEYRAPADIDAGLAAARLAEALRVAPAVLGVSSAQVFLKRRERSRGGSQYGPSSSEAGSSAVHLIEESGLVFEVDLAGRLDTGIFLDHRITRGLLREKAAGQDCLNLFAYTGTASVYMAAGGARSVTTVDMSRVYLDWAQRNMERNGFIGDKTPRLSFEQADVLSWLQQQNRRSRRYGLVFVDVPTFSNSSRMGGRDWDVQRDHVELLAAVCGLLASGGEAVFSTNLRSFRPDLAALAAAGIELRDISAQTIPPDFERSPRIHRCYLVRVGEG